MNQPAPPRDPLEELADSFVQRYRCGEHPSVDQYAAAHPELADEIRDLFPALVMMEEAAVEGSESATPVDGPAPRRLGDYRIVREIGRGGMGVVYEAVQESLGRHVALKVLPSYFVGDSAALSRFQREAQAAARLHHTNIVPVFGIGHEEGTYYYAMQFIQGHALDVVLDELRRMRKGRRPPTEPGVSSTFDNLAQSAEVGTVEFTAGLLDGLQDLPDAAEERGKREDGRGASVDSAAETERHVAKPQAAETGAKPQAAEGFVVPTSAGSCEDDRLKAALQNEDGRLEAGLRTDHSTGGSVYYSSAARIALQVADALAYAHAQGILHRDIKPANLLLDARGTVWITDFGLAKDAAQDQLTHTGDLLGTLRYMAPERFKGLSDARSDVYSLGLTLYEMITLRPAFDQSDRGKLLRQVERAEPTPPRRLDPHLPRDLETIVLKAIAREPGHRYQSAAALAEDLRRYLADRPIEARRASTVEHAWRWCRRNPLVAGMAGMLVVALLLIAGGSLAAAVQLRTERNTAVANQERAEEAERQAVAARKRAEQAEHEAKERLWEAYLAQAGAQRRTGRAGQRFDALKAIAAAAAMRGSPELRGEAIASLALVDLRIEKEWNVEPPRPVQFDYQVRRYSTHDAARNISIRRVGDNAELLNLPSSGHHPDGLMLFSIDGRWFAERYFVETEGRQTAECRVWSLDTGKVVFKTPVAAPAFAMGFTPDSRAIGVIGPDGAIRIFPLPPAEAPDGSPEATAAKVKTFLASPEAVRAAGAPEALAFSPDGRHLALFRVDAPDVYVFDLQQEKVVQKLAHPKGVMGIAWSPNGRHLAAGCRDFRAYVWDALAPREDKLLAVLIGHQAEVVGLEFNAGGDLLASRSWDGTTRLWRPLDGQQLVRIEGDFRRFSRDDRRLGFRTLDTAGVWEVATGRECLVLCDPLRQGKGPWAASFHPTRPLLATAGDGGVALWDTTAGRQIAVLPVARVSAVFDAEGANLFTAGIDGLKRWPVVAEPGDRLRLGPPQLLHGPVNSISPRIALSRDNRFLAAIAGGKEVEVHNLAADTKVLLDGHPGVLAVDISPDGRWAATGTWVGRGLKVWDAREGKLIRDLMPECLSAASRFSPDGRWLVTTTDFEYRFWKTGTWESDRGIKLGRGGRGGALGFSPDGRLLAIAKTRYLPQLIDVATGDVVATLEPPQPIDLCWLSFSPDGSRLAACTASHAIHVWDLRAIRSRLAAWKLDWHPPLEGPAHRSPRPVSAIEVLER